MESLEEYLPLWTTEKDRYRLVRLQFPDGRWFYDIYRWDGAYCTPFDQELCRTVTERMLAAGVPVWDADDWALELKMQPYQDLWSGDPAEYLVVRSISGEGPPHDVIYDQDGEWYPYRIWDDALRSAVIRRMRAAGVELIETRHSDGGPPHSGDEQVTEEHYYEDFTSTCLFKLLNRPSFDPWSSLRFLAYWEGEERAFVVRYLTWEYSNPLPFRERVRLPQEDQGWELRLVRKERSVDAAVVTVLMQHLRSLQVPVYLNALICDDDTFADVPHGRDGTSFRLTFGNYPAESRWAWWGDGPEAWQPITQFARDAHEQLSRLFGVDESEWDWAGLYKVERSWQIP